MLLPAFEYTNLISSNFLSSLFAFNATLLTTDVTLLSTAFSCFISLASRIGLLVPSELIAEAFAIDDIISVLMPLGA